MKQWSKMTKSGIACLLAVTVLAGCGGGETNAPAPQSIADETVLTEETDNVKVETGQGAQIAYTVDPETFAVAIQTKGGSLPVSSAMPGRPVAELKEENGVTGWSYEEEQISVLVEPTAEYLSVAITSQTTEDAVFAWPVIQAEEYYLPLGEGKRVPAEDPVWSDYLNGSEFSVLEQLSMPFWASSMGDYAVVYIMEDPYRTKLQFAEDASISFEVAYEYPEISEDRTKRFRIYVTENNPTAVAKIYRSYVIENGSFVSLEEKSKAVPETKKLYGAPFIYLWGDRIVSPTDIKWEAFRGALDSPVMAYLLTFAPGAENGEEYKNTIEEVRGQDYVGDYQKNIICAYLSSVLEQDAFYDAAILTKSTPAMDSLLQKGVGKLSESERIQLHKHALFANLPGVFAEVSTWMNGETVDLFADMKASGIGQAWIGLHGWEQAYAKPELVKEAADLGYLIASYDSYHSIHEPGSEQWETARFDDLTLYEQATVTDQEGVKIGGFQNVGRKLNPVLAMPSVKERMKRIIEENELAFNSWFVDCDATGEIYDDYTSGHVTTQEEDVAARMERIAYIGETYGAVTGSEGGNDFAAPTIAYAHGIELKSFAWMDPDMNKNKESEYYIGKYYSPTGGVAEHFAKRIPLKETYITLFVDPAYDLPLFKLVYQDSVISSYHWEWPTFKIKDMTQKRMVREILYNVPPMYHLDAAEWAEYKEDIVNHTTVWSRFSRQAAEKEMTAFTYLTEDGLVQYTQYGTDIYVVANFQETPYQYEGQEIPAESALIYMDGKADIYTPALAEEHR